MDLYSKNQGQIIIHEYIGSWYGHIDHAFSPIHTGIIGGMQCVFFFLNHTELMSSRTVIIVSSYLV